jgi:hypothetical protein
MLKKVISIADLARFCSLRKQLIDLLILESEMKRFRAPKSLDEEKKNLEEAIPSNTRYSTKWVLNIFKE